MRAWSQLTAAQRNGRRVNITVLEVAQDDEYRVPPGNG